MKYIPIYWPDIQEYMTRSDWKGNHYYDPTKDTWLIPESWKEDFQEFNNVDI